METEKKKITITLLLFDELRHAVRDLINEHYLDKECERTPAEDRRYYARRIKRLERLADLCSTERQIALLDPKKTWDNKEANEPS